MSTWPSQGASHPGSLRIIGVDPGSRLLGYGIIERTGNRLQPVAHGTLVGRGSDFAARLVPMVAELRRLVHVHRPSVLAVETAFAGKNVHSALVLGQVRGAVVVGLADLGLSVHEYAPSQVKLAATGTGGADKEQVQRMVRLLLGLQAVDMGIDASDALAVAICHAQVGERHAHCPGPLAPPFARRRL